MAWRAPAVEAVLGAPIDASSLTEDVLRRLVENGAREGEQLDFKATPHLSESGRSAPVGSAVAATKATPKPEKDWSAEQEFAKDVCAFANHLGGVLLIGVEEKNQTAVGLKASAIDPGAVEQRLRFALANYAAPVPKLECIAIEAESGGYYLALVVPASSMAPHAVRAPSGTSKRPLYYVVRDGADTRWLLEAEVAERYRARTTTRDERDARREVVVEQGLDALKRAPHDDLWLYVAIAPESSADVQFDRATAAAMQDWLRDTFHSPLGRFLHFQATPTPAPGRLTVSGHAGSRESDEDADPRNEYVELYVDGRAFVASSITARTGTDKGVVGELTLADDVMLLTDLTVDWACHQVGAWGSAEVVVGLSGSDTGAFASNVTLHESVSDGLRRISGTRALRGPVRAATSVDLSSGDNQQSRLAAARDVHTVLLQHFGIPESGQLGPDGRILAWGWGRKRTEVVRWAQERGLAVQEDNA